MMVQPKPTFVRNFFQARFIFMGVDGLWPIVSSKGKLVTLEILSDKVIAIDASIWIYQFANALKDGDGEPLRNSHIVGFFKRICKLLFLRIKPIFVFDGPPIPLKFAALRKRKDDSISDGMYKKAAEQLLRQNLLLLQTGKPAVPEIVSSPLSDSSIDEVQVLSDSSSDEGLSPSRRLRLTVPEEFRGFVSERRTLDCVNLPVSPEKLEEDSKFSRLEDVSIDLETLRDLPLHEQYRGLLQARSALLSQGRRKALHVASRLHGVGGDLSQLSTDQVEAFVKLAKITDMSKAIRMQMIREANKEEDHVYVPPSAPPPPKRRKHHFDPAELKDSFLTSAQSQSRNDLLFGSLSEPPVKSSQELKTEEVKLEDDIAKLFGTQWADLFGAEELDRTQIQLNEVDSITEQEPSLVPTEVQLDKVDSTTEEEPSFVPTEVQLDKVDFTTEEKASDSQVDELVAAEVRLENIDSQLDEQDGASSSSFYVSEFSAHLDSYQPKEVEPELGDQPEHELESFFLLDDQATAFPEFRVISDSGDLGQTYIEIQELLTAFGIPWVSAPADAEAQCAYLCEAGLADAVVSDDSDTLVFSAGFPTAVFRKLFGTNELEMFQCDRLGFSHPDQLISLALLLGCDFTEGVRGIGPVNATEIVRRYSGMEGLRQFRLWAESEVNTEEDEFHFSHKNIRHQWVFPKDFPSQEVWDVFANPNVDRSLEPFSWAPVDPVRVRDLVCPHVSSELVEPLLESTVANYAKTTLQRRITDYFSPTFQRGQVAQVVSKRLQRALH